MPTTYPQAMPPAPTFASDSVAAAAGFRSSNYTGSYEDWLNRAATALANRYMRGERVFDNFSGATGPIGQPDGSDFNSGAGGGTGHISTQTYDFFMNYLKTYAASDPYIGQQFGSPPTQHATWEDASPGATQVKTQGTFEQQTNATAQRDANQQASDERRAQIAADASRYDADQQLAGVKLKVGNDWATAVMQDATSRYVAEGQWGVQKYVAELQEKGQMDRLQLELAQNDKQLAQEALAERDHHQEAMVGLIMQVADYDQKLASEPHNWVAYATWLKDRGQVVNGLSLATVATSSIANSINPAEVANSAGSPGAGIAAIQENVVQQKQAAATQQVGAQTAGTGPQQPGAQQPQGVNTAQPVTAQPAAQGAPGTINGIDLNNPDYVSLANQILGLGGNGTPPSTEQLQATYDSLKGQGSHQQGFGDWSGATTNSLGMKVNPLGQKNDFRRYASLLPSQQSMLLGADTSTGKYEPDYVQELNRSRPKGAVQGAAAWG